MTDWPFGDLRPAHYGAILADPPWRFQTWSAKGEGRSPQRHYRCMELAEVQALPVRDLALRDCLLFLWATAPMLPQALTTMETWGFRYSTGGAWAKQNSSGVGWRLGTGFRLRSSAEFWLIGQRGSPGRISRSETNLIVAPVGRHSAKPAGARRKIKAMVNGPYCELFARERTDGWDSWGDELDAED